MKRVKLTVRGQDASSANTINAISNDQDKTHHSVSDTIPRQGLWHALTPQIFRYGLLKRALDKAIAGRLTVTDEAQAIELMGYAPKLIEGSQDNLKITFPRDLQLAQFFLRQQESEGGDVLPSVIPQD